MATRNHVYSRKITPAVLGFKATAVNAEATSNVFYVGDGTEVQFDVDYNQDGATGDLTMDFEVSDDGSTGWKELVIESISGATVTLVDGAVVFATSSGALDFSYGFSVSHQFMRMKATVAGGSPTTSDTITVIARIVSK